MRIAACPVHADDTLEILWTVPNLYAVETARRRLENAVHRLCKY